MIRTASNKAATGVVDLVDGLIDRAIAGRASDIHFEPADCDLRVRFRIDGRLHDVERLPIALLPNVVTRLKVMARLLSYRQDIPQEGGLTLERGKTADADSDGRVDVRISTFPTIRGERVAVRLLPRVGQVRGLDELGFSEALVQRLVSAAGRGQGLILVTGPAGSGKTTTLYALLRHLLVVMPGAGMMTVEDPVELRLDGIAQIQVTPHGELTYVRALRSLLRQDPQVILIGEIRDAETARIATEAALTGHLILSTMHSGRACDAVVRLMEMGIPPYQLTSSLRLVMCQRLIRTLCDRCGGESRLGGETLSEIPANRADPAGVNRIVRPPPPEGAGRPSRPQPPEGAGHPSPDSADDSCETGRHDCNACLNIGFRGRTACAEHVEMTAVFRTAILDRADSRRLTEVIESSTGYVSLLSDADRHVEENRTTLEEVRAWITE